MATTWADPDLWIAVLVVSIALGFVIFVHELGHFAVAKLCGVKCEKFYLGFDIAGLRLCRFTWGETEYGIGILPLGGYVKMLGQEDNPARLREEIERAKQKQAGDEAPASSADDAKSEAKRAESDQPPGEEIDVKAAEKALFDPRSYLAQSVPRRMAIISAGVIMNLVFAFVMAVLAFEMGVERVKCVVGQTIPGEAAWQEGLRSGDQILEIAGRKIEKFRDMQQAVSLGDNLEQGIPVFVKRPGVKDRLSFTVMPDSSGLLPRIGIISSSKTRLQTEGLAAVPGSAAAQCSPKLMLGDQIVQIDDTPIETYAELHAYLALHRDKPLTVVVERGAATEGRKDQASSGTQRLTITVAPNPMCRLGLAMEMGEISAVQKGSPAARAGIRPGDLITKVDGQPPGDPMTLPDRLRQLAGETITLTVQRKDKPIDFQVTLRRAEWFETPAGDLIPLDLPVAVPSLGIAYAVGNRVHSPIEGSPAAEAGLRAGDEVGAAELIPPKQQTPEESKLGQRKMSLEFDEDNRSWPSMIYTLQRLLPGTQVELHWTRQNEEKTNTLQPKPCNDWFNPDRGFLLESLTFVEKAQTHGQAVRLGAEETVHATLLVYRILQKLGTRQVSPRALGGPISIFRWLKHAAEQSFPELLITLTLLSANLAVLNFLPIPLLDGGHMVFLTWEAVRGKPANERVQLVLTYLGLIIILTLMVWVISLDIGLIPRQ